jgi:hypothetical protein
MTFFIINVSSLLGGSLQGIKRLGLEADRKPPYTAGIK